MVNVSMLCWDHTGTICVVVSESSKLRKYKLEYHSVYGGEPLLVPYGKCIIAAKFVSHDSDMDSHWRISSMSWTADSVLLLVLTEKGVLSLLTRSGYILRLMDTTKPHLEAQTMFCKLFVNKVSEQNQVCWLGVVCSLLM